jgi:hypothetical protein
MYAKLHTPGMYNRIRTLKSPVIVKNKTFWTSVGHVKMTFSLLLEDISKTYERFECFLPGVGLYNCIRQVCIIVYVMYV